MNSNFQVNQWFKKETSLLLIQALKSTGILGGQVVLLLLLSLFLGVLWDNLRPPFKFLGGALVTGGAVFCSLKAHDTQEDWEVWFSQNSGEKREKVMDQVTQASLASLRNYQFSSPPEDLAAWTYRKQVDHYLKYLERQWDRGNLEPFQPQVTQLPGETLEPKDPSDSLSQDPYSTIIAGVPSAGKGMTVSHGIRKLRAKFPNIQVTVLDPKNDPQESGYWEIEGVTVERFSAMSRSPEELRDWLLDEIESFKKSLHSPRLLVIDEMAMVLATLGTISPKKESGIQDLKVSLSQIVSGGDSRGMWVWLLTQVVNASDLGFSAGFRDMMRSLALISPRNQNAAKALLRTSFVDNIGFPEVLRYCEASEVGRAFYDGTSGTWHPVAKLHNFSQVDRDSRFQ